MQLFILIKKNIPHRQTAGIFNNRKWTWNGTIGHLFPVTFMNPFAFGTCFNHLTIPALGGEKFAFLQFKSKLWELVSPTDFGKLQSRILITCRLVTNFPFWEKKSARDLQSPPPPLSVTLRHAAFLFLLCVLSTRGLIFKTISWPKHERQTLWQSVEYENLKRGSKTHIPQIYRCLFICLGKKNHQHFPCAV